MMAKMKRQSRTLPRESPQEIQGEMSVVTEATYDEMSSAT